MRIANGVMCIPCHVDNLLIHQTEVSLNWGLCHESHAQTALPSSATIEMDLVNVDILNKAELQTLCKERGLKAGKKASKVDLQIAFWAYEAVKRLQTATEEEDPEGDLRLDEEEDQGPQENQ
ncbi:hypothetical protein NDU88_001503 [Pleurodeles waltl]|uniref:Uncharacterized protein n=1 Tax=Pleurodeles waltl TaxID=8319 RepID=A0AAV7P455_PLEWA|nr:hypothetical protein NDU88_001503 [Pleurodeles waltl]